MLAAVSDAVPALGLHRLNFKINVIQLFCVYWAVLFFTLLICMTCLHTEMATIINDHS